MSAIPIARILKVSRTWLIARCIAACAHRTEILAQIAEIELAATKRDKISRGEVERAFAMAGAMIKAHILRLAADAPCALLGCSPAEKTSGWRRQSADP